MAVLKNKTQGLYVNVSKEILTDKNLSLRDRGMLVTVLSLSDNWDFNVRGFAKILPDGVDGIGASIKELTERGYLTRGQERSEGGKFGRNIIEVHQTPQQPCREKPYTVKSVTEKPYTAEPYTENPRQVINNKVNNKQVMNNGVNNHQSINQEDGAKELIPLEKLVEIGNEEECRSILTYPYLLREISECNLTMFEIKQRVIEELKLLISYEVFESTEDASMVAALLDYMSEIIALGNGVTFQDVTYDVHTVGNQFYQLDCEAIRYVLWKFKEASEVTKIKNKKNYLIRMLITAKSDMHTSIAGDVNYDMAHWHERGRK